VTPRESILVDVDPASMDRFLAGTPQAVGALVRVVEGDDLSKGVFWLEPLDSSPPAPPTDAEAEGRPQFDGVRGVVVSRVANVLMVRTARGVVPVVIQRLASIRFGESGLTPDDVREGQLIVGHEVSVSGNLERPNGRRVIASLIVVLPKPASR
jgi:RNase P/RNase MRP subunit p29